MLRLSMLLVGLALLALVLIEVDLTAVWHGLLTLGLWGAVAVAAIYFIAFLIDTASWQLTLPNAELTLVWLYRLWKVRMVGEALNVALPAASLGGEPVKALLLKRSQQVTYRESGASLIITRTVNLLALVVFSGIGFLLLLAKGTALPAGYRLAAGIGLAGLGFGVFGFFAVQRWKLASRLAAWLSSCRVVAPLGGGLIGALALLQEIDSRFHDFYVGRPRRFALAFLLAFANWATGAFELYAIMRFLERPISYAEAWLIEAAVQLVRAGAFFIPAGLGAIEGVLVLLYAALVGDGALGLVVAVIRRARDLLWILWGLALAWRFAPRKPAQAGEGR